MVEFQPDWPALLRFLNSQGLEASHSDEDFGYGVHAWLAAAFGELAPKPWRLLLDGQRPPRILGYSSHPAENLRQQIGEFADPGVYAVCPEPEARIASRMMPTFGAGRRLAFELLGCPVGRKARSGIEKDLFLVHCDRQGNQGPTRESVYCEWAKEQIRRDRAATVLQSNLPVFDWSSKFAEVKEEKEQTAQRKPWFGRGQLSVASCAWMTRRLFLKCLCTA